MINKIIQKIIWDIPDEQVYVVQWLIFDLKYIHKYSATDTNS